MLTASVEHLGLWTLQCIHCVIVKPFLSVFFCELYHITAGGHTTARTASHHAAVLVYIKVPTGLYTVNLLCIQFIIVYNRL